LTSTIVFLHRRIRSPAHCFARNLTATGGGESWWSTHDRNYAKPVPPIRRAWLPRAYRDDGYHGQISQSSLRPSSRATTSAIVPVVIRSSRNHSRSCGHISLAKFYRRTSTLGTQCYAQSALSAQVDALLFTMQDTKPTCSWSHRCVRCSPSLVTMQFLLMPECSDLLCNMLLPTLGAHQHSPAAGMYPTRAVRCRTRHDGVLGPNPITQSAAITLLWARSHKCMHADGLVS